MPTITIPDEFFHCFVIRGQWFYCIILRHPPFIKKTNILIEENLQLCLFHS